MKASAIATLVSLSNYRRREAAPSGAVLPKRRPIPQPMTTNTLIADAIRELELYDDEEHRVALQLVREILDLDASETSYVD